MTTNVMSSELMLKVKICLLQVLEHLIYLDVFLKYIYPIKMDKFLQRNTVLMYIALKQAILKCEKLLS